MVALEKVAQPGADEKKSLMGNQPSHHGEKKRRFRRSLKVLPNLFTLSNAFFGFCAIVFAAHKNPQAAAYCILLGASMDALDGRVARLTQNTSALGMQLDSLADAVTFCLAPAFMLYMWSDGLQPSLINLFCCGFYLLAGIFRLARFNVTSSQQTSYFLGLPTTLAGCFLATAILSFPLSQYAVFTPVLMTLLGYLMVSRWRFPTFKQASKRWLLSSCMLIAVTVATFGCNRVLCCLYGLYLLWGIAGTLYQRCAKSQTRP
jgi:CDP-diacylglycerol--serine O-phosphatidyltransferase